MTSEQIQAELQRLEALLVLLQVQAAEPSELEITFIFRPGDPGPLAPNVFTDWNALMTAASRVQGFRVVEIQNDFTPIPVIPAGVYNMRSIILTASFNNAGSVQCNLADGVVFQNFRNVRNNLLLNSLSTSVPVFTLGQEPVLIERGAGIKSDPTATVPFVRVPAVPTGPIVLLTGGTVGGPGPSSATIQVDAGATLTMILDLAAGLAPNVIVGAGTAFIVVSSQSAFINTPFPIVQGGIGVLNVAIFAFAETTQTNGPSGVLVAANWAAPPLANVLDALNRIAAVLNANFGPIP